MYRVVCDMFRKLTLNDPVFNVPGLLLPSIENGAKKRGCTLAVIHCSATFPNQRVTVQDIDHWHRQRGFDGIGYHYYITVDGTIWIGRPLSRIGAHCKGYNAHSIGICYEGGLDKEGRPCDTRTLVQKAALVALLNKLHENFPTMAIVGHNDLNPYKTCPCFNVTEEYKGLLRHCSVRRLNKIVN